MIYRTANHEDLSWLLDYERDLMKEAPEDPFWIKGGILTSPLIRLDHVYVADEGDGVPVGMVCAIPMDGTSWYLVDLYVKPSQRGKGVARGLIGHARDEQRKTGRTAVMAVVATQVENLYTNLGFGPVGRAMGIWDDA